MQQMVKMEVSIVGMWCTAKASGGVGLVNLKETINYNLESVTIGKVACQVVSLLLHCSIVQFITCGYPHQHVVLSGL